MSASEEPEVLRGLVILPSRNLGDDLAWFSETLGFRLERIEPADDPRRAEMSGHGLHIRLQRCDGEGGGDLTAATLCLRALDTRLAPDDPDAPGTGELVSPGGTRVLRERETSAVVQAPTVHQLEIRRLADEAPWIIGRAGMHYRDLIPSRLGGSVIASHIRIPVGGAVPDMVHYHAVGFQLIHCVQGRVRLVYEDQGEPFWLEAGDSVTQPPRIRHRVLEASEGLEVVEVGVPAEHVTTIDHEMSLPTRVHAPERLFCGQRFCRSRAAEAQWQPHSVPGLERRDTGVAQASGGVASVFVVRACAPSDDQATPRSWQIQHDADIHFSFVLAGALTLDGRRLVAGDAFALPPGERYTLELASADLAPGTRGVGERAEWLEVGLPGNFVLSA